MVLTSLKSTEKLAINLLDKIPKGSLLILSGDLGVGKTTLTQQIGWVLGIRASMSSPTYTLIHEYPTLEGTLIHIDAYRLPQAKALINLGLDDYLSKARLVVVEWGEGLQELYNDSWFLRLNLSEGIRYAELSYQGQVVDIM